MSPLILLVKAPNPPPSKVLVESAMVGPVVVLQHTPRAVTAEVPMLVTVPPEMAEDEVIVPTAAVETVGSVKGLPDSGLKFKSGEKGAVTANKLPCITMDCMMISNIMHNCLISFMVVGL